MSKNIKIRGIRGICFTIDEHEYQNLSEFLPLIVKSKKFSHVDTKLKNGKWRIKFSNQVQISPHQLSSLQKNFKSINFENLRDTWKDPRNDSKILPVKKNYGNNVHFKFLENLLTDNLKKRSLDGDLYQPPSRKVWFYEDENGQRFMKSKDINKIFNNFIENLAGEFHNNNISLEKDKKNGEKISLEELSWNPCVCGMNYRQIPRPEQRIIQDEEEIGEREEQKEEERKEEEEEEKINIAEREEQREEERREQQEEEKINIEAREGEHQLHEIQSCKL